MLSTESSCIIREKVKTKSALEEAAKYLRGRNRTVTETFSLARFKKSSLLEVGVRGLPADAEEAELCRNFGGGVTLEGGVGMLLLPLPGVKDIPIVL